MPSIQRDYIYKVFRDGSFLGVIPNVTSPFKYNLLLNSAGAQLDIVIQRDPYEAQSEVDILITEDGDELITEDGDNLTTERPYPLFGNDWDGSLIRNGNDVEVWEISDDNPEGVKVFEGYISKWRGNFGGSDIIGCTVLSYGVELDQYLIQTGNTEQDALELSTATLAGAFWGNAYAQAFIPNADFRLSQVDLKCRVTSGSAQISLQLCQGNPDNDQINVIGGEFSYTFGSGNSVIASSAPVTVSNTTAAVKSFVFSTLPQLSAGGQYYLLIEDSFGLTTFELTTAGLADLPISQPMIQNFYYARATINNASFGLDYNTANPVLYVVLYSSGGSVLSPYTDADPGTILTSIIDNYVGQGGHVNYDTGTIESTGTQRSYTFNLNTTLEGIKKCLELAPANWYFYVDPADSKIYFKETNTTGDHKLVLGQHIGELNLEADIENLKNLIYFSGGDGGGGVNVFVKGQDTTSLENYPQGLAKISDNRVTTGATANAIVENFLDNNASERYISQLVIPAAVYDISSIDPGETVSFGGFGNLVDFLVLQIVSVNRESDRVTVGLGMLPKRATELVEAAQRSITDIQTIDNPSTPS